MPSFSVSGRFVDLNQQKIYPAEITVEDGKISAIREIANVPATTHYILPGFIDSHVHIESSMLVPSEFARLAVVHGTVATVSDPHEIANVCGMEGVAGIFQGFGAADIDKVDLAVEEGEHFGQQVGYALIGGP